MKKAQPRRLSGPLAHPLNIIAFGGYLDETEGSMAAFEDKPETFERVDWRLLQNGPITLYRRDAYLDEDCRLLKGHGYELTSLDCSRWQTEETMHHDIAAALSFPDYYGQNLDALNDCISDLTIPATGGRAVVLRRYDVFALACPKTAQHVLDIFADQSRRFLLFGLRLVILLQSDNPNLRFETVGATSVGWNRREWLDKDRGL